MVAHIAIIVAGIGRDDIDGPGQIGEPALPAGDRFFYLWISQQFRLIEIRVEKTARAFTKTPVSLRSQFPLEPERGGIPAFSQSLSYDRVVLGSEHIIAAGGEEGLAPGRRRNA
jgi:hypothetical protein